MDDLNRRQFIKKSAASIVVTSTCLCTLNGCATITKIGNTPAINPDAFNFEDNILTIDLSKESNLSKVGEAVKIIHKGISDGLIIARVEDRRFVIASLLCTHRGVELEYDHSQASFECSSLGGSTFTFDGKNASGPADKPLKIYEATFENDVLHIRI